MSLQGQHICNYSSNFGDWRIDGDYRVLNLKDIEHLLTKDRLRDINHKDICWKGMNKVKLLQRRKRYEQCDISFPCIVSTNSVNPCNSKYRLIDGKHRMAKMNSKNINNSSFYVIDFWDFHRYLEKS